MKVFRNILYWIVGGLAAISLMGFIPFEMMVSWVIIIFAGWTFLVSEEDKHGNN